MALVVLLLLRPAPVSASPKGGAPECHARIAAHKTCELARRTHQPARPLDLPSTTDRSCLDCGKTWVSCDLTDADLLAIENVVRRRDKRTIYSVMSAPDCSPKTKGKFFVNTAVSCSPERSYGASILVERTKTGWAIVKLEERER